jgi:hypothetical protein
LHQILEKNYLERNGPHSNYHLLRYPTSNIFLNDDGFSLKFEELELNQNIHSEQTKQKRRWIATWISQNGQLQFAMAGLISNRKLLKSNLKLW